MAELNNTLFSDQELEDMKDGLISNAEEKGPVTVLGKTFANDDERRAYFREEKETAGTQTHRRLSYRIR